MQQWQEKKHEGKKKKRIGAEDTPSTPTQAIDALMGEEEENRKQKEEQKQETGRRPPTQLPGPFGRLVRPTWIIRWAYSETRPQGEGDIYYLFIYH